MIETLRILPENRIQIFAILGSILLFFFIITLIKKKRLKEEYAILWLASCVLFILISAFKPILDLFALLIGIYYAPTALLLSLIIAIMIILIHYSTVISKLSTENKVLTQELALLKHKVQIIEKNIT